MSGLTLSLFWPAGVISWVFFLLVWQKPVLHSSSAMPPQLFLAAYGLFILIALLTVKYLSIFIGRVMCPVPVSVFAAEAGYKPAHSPLEIPPITMSERIDKANNKPAHIEQTQVKVVNSSDNNPMPAPPRPTENLDRALTIVNQIGQTLTTSLHLLDVVSICRAVLYSAPLKDLFLFDIAEICLWNDRTNTLSAILHWPEDETERTYRVDEGYTGWLAAHQSPLLIADTHQADITPKAGLDNFPCHSFVGVPLKVGLKMLGTLELAAVPLNAYQQSDVLLLEILANQLAIAIDHARLFEETQRKVSELSLLFEASRELSATLSYDELMRNLSRQMIKAFPVDDCAMFEFDEAVGVFKLTHQCRESTPGQASEVLYDFDQESFGRAITDSPAWQVSLKKYTPCIIRATDSATHPKDIELLRQCHCGSIVALPLVSRDQLTGLLALFSVDPQVFSDEQIPLAQSLANQAGIALENAHLFGLTDQRLQRRLDELAGLQRVSSELNSTLDLHHILRLVLEEALRVTQADLGHVCLYDAAAGQLTTHKEGRPGQPITDTMQSDNPDGQIMMEHVLHLGQAVLISDVQQYKDYVGFGAGTRSRVVVPIYYGSEPAGVINLESNRFNSFTETQLRYLEALANQAAVAIGNAQAYEVQRHEREQASRRIEQLSRLAEISNVFRTNRPLPEVLEEIAYAIIDSVGYNVVLISLALDEPPVLHHEVGAGIPLTQFEELRRAGEPPLLADLQQIMQPEFRLSKAYFIPVERQEVWQGKLNLTYTGRERSPEAQTGQPATNGHLWQAGDLLFVPLTDTDDNLIGLLTVDDPDTSERPTLAAVQTLEIFANHAATAIENARLFKLEQQRRLQADTLRGVAEAISSQLEFDELLNIVLRELANVVDYNSALVHRLDEDQLVVIGGRAWEYSQQLVGLSFSMMEVNPYRLVIETQEPVIIKDAQTQYPHAFGSPPYDRIKGWLGVPLTYGTNILGLMSLGSTEADFFTHEDASVTLTFANQVAVAMQNARLFNEARQQVRQLAALTEVAQALNRALDLNAVLNLVLDAVFDLVGRSQGSIWLIDRQSNTVKIANTANISEFLVELFNESAVSVDSEPFASVIKSGEVVVVESSGQRKDDIANYGLPFPDDVTYVPLKTEAGVIGILAIETVIHTPAMLQLVNTLADLAAIAIDNTRLLENTRQRANEMQRLYDLGVEVSGVLDVQEVMSSVINNAVTLTETQMGLILFWDEERQRYLVDGTAANEKLRQKFEFDHLLPSAENGLPGESNQGAVWHNLTQHIIDSSQPININLSPRPGTGRLPPDPRLSLPTEQVRQLGLQAMLGVPIGVSNQINGAIFIGSVARRNFTQHDIQLVSFVANQATVAVRNAQLVQRLNLLTEELEQRVAQRTDELARTLEDLTEERDRVEALYQITRELSASLDLDRILNQSLSLINRAVGISHGSILLVNQETGNLIYRAALGRDTPLPRNQDDAKREVDYILAQRTIDARNIQVIPDLSADPDEALAQDTLGRHSAVAVPLLIGDDVAGAVLLFHPDVDYFTDDHLKLIAAASSQIATAINNAELYRLITDQADRLGLMLRTQATEAAKNEAILRGITDGVLVLDPDRNVVLVNPKAAEILEIEPMTVENQSLERILGQSNSLVAQELTQRFYDNFLKALTEIEAGELSPEFRIEVKHKAMIVTLAPVALGPEERPSIVTVLRDISREAEVERIKNEFISTVSHELRTPLTSIKGYADLLASATTHVGELNPMQHRFVGIIQSNTNRLANLVNDILEISRIETGRVKLELESLDIVSVVNEVAVSFQAQLLQKPMNFSVDMPDSLPHVYADKARVVQVLVNLIGNAWRYTPADKDIIVRVSVRDNRFVQIDVEDTGIGIVEKDLPYLFDRFFRSERTEVEMVDGTGLGLSITKSLVEMMGGDIWVKSQVDVGSIFSFTLPLEATVLEAFGHETGHFVEGSHLLLVEDDPAVVALLKPGLEQAGYQVTVAGKPAEALTLARNASQTVALIMLDPLLKHADGFELLTQLRADDKTASIPVLISALRAEDQMLTLTAVDYIAASFDESKILETVHLVLEDTAAAHNQAKTDRTDRVLIVNRDAALAQRLKDALDSCGCRVQRAFNSQQALDMAASLPDLILAEAGMPGLDNQTVIDQLGRTPETNTVPIIVITDKAVPPPNQAAVSVLGRIGRVDTKQPLSVEAVVAEIGQIGHNVKE